MKKYISVLKNSKLFHGTEESDIYSILNCFQAKVLHYKKGEYIIRHGDVINNIMILLDGCLCIQRDDYWGNRSIVNIVNIGEMFGEAYTAHDSKTILNDVTAIKDSSVIFLNINKVLNICSCVNIGECVASSSERKTLPGETTFLLDNSSMSSSILALISAMTSSCPLLVKMRI